MNPRHSVLETDVLPLNYTPKNLVGLAGLEPATSRLSGVRSNHLSYRPVLIKKNGRGGETRTPGPMVPNHVRYQTALHLEKNMAEKEGFEPSRPLTRPTPLAGEPLQPLEYFSNCVQCYYGGEGGIRTHGPFRNHWFSRPAP